MTASTLAPNTGDSNRPVFPAYPVPRPEERDDRYSPELIADVALVLERHGYPPIADMRDRAALGLHVHRFLYLGS